jgi:hypothetical protein
MSAQLAMKRVKHRQHEPLVSQHWKGFVRIRSGVTSVLGCVKRSCTQHLHQTSSRREEKHHRPIDCKLSCLIMEVLLGGKNWIAVKNV